MQNHTTDFASLNRRPRLMRLDALPERARIALFHRLDGLAITTLTSGITLFLG